MFNDEKGHAGQITIDTGTLIWLHAVHGVEPLDVPEFTQWNTDIRVIADAVLNETKSKTSDKSFPRKIARVLCKPLKTLWRSTMGVQSPSTLATD